MLLHAAPATATEPSCTPELATAAEQAVAVLPGAYKARRTWKDLHYLYVKYVKRAGCDDGAIAEGWSYAVGHLLAYRWGELPELNRLAKADPDFLTFVLRHIDLTLPGEDLDNLRTKATMSCPYSCEMLCGKVRQAVDAAKAEVHMGAGR